jgi:L-lactate dehydrogenase complex protein LldG
VQLTETTTNLARELAAGRRVVAEPSATALLGAGVWREPAPDADPHSFADVAVAIIPGTIGVAENAAVAVEGKRVPHRALPFLCEHLILLLPVAAIVPDLHRALASLPPDATRFHHLTWISGPSKTADIELALVLGAHGPLSCHVIGYQAG